MKTFAVLLPMLSLAMIGYGGQTNQIHLHSPAAPPQPPARESGGLAVMPPTNSMQRFFRAQKSYGGVLPEVRRRKGQFFRSTAPNRTGEFQNVSVNPTTGRAEGLVLFSVNF